MNYFDLTKENIVLFSGDINNPYSRDSDGASIYYKTRDKLEELGALLGKELNLVLKNNYTVKPNQLARQGKPPVLKEYILTGFIPTEYLDQVGDLLFIKLLLYDFEDKNPHFLIEIGVKFSEPNNPFNSFQDEFAKQAWSIPVKDLPDNKDDFITLITPHFQRQVDYIHSYFSKMEIAKEMQSYIKLLEANKNLILTGVPGTGKTYLAKEIAEAMGEYEFVQFHPSYDYTDFVEGLRPLKKDGGELGFDLKDGIFKTFCKKALRNLIDSRKSQDELKKEDVASNNIRQFLDECVNSGVELELSSGNKFTVLEYDDTSIKVKVPGNAKTSDLTLPFNELSQLLLNEYKLTQVQDVRIFFARTHNRQSDSYIFSLYNNSDLLKKLTTDAEISKVKEKKFIFIIDEINRAEIPKVFGELFFSIDPGYRGESGKVKTQYANLQDESDIFYNGFYIPENVYIIGTMNDIDRSVDSMDFAMRRRFAWKEVTALERVSMWDNKIEKFKDDAKDRMEALNRAIEKVQGLSSAYHIGPSYFLKLNEYKEEESPFELLWENHLKGVIFEYLRGLPNLDEELATIKHAYNLNNDA